MPQLNTINLGRREYAATLALQRRLVERARSADDGRGYLLLVEHDPPVITLGRRADDSHVVADAARLAAERVEVHDVSRGGDVTYHGPGQLVGYPIVRLDLRGRDIHRYLRELEEVLIRVLARYGLTGERVEGLTGVWVDDEKVAAIGVAVSRSVTYHGFALNVAPNMEHFGLIVPCGIGDRRVTSLVRLLDRPIAVEDVAAAVVREFADVFGYDDVRRLADESELDEPTDATAEPEAKR